jgi:hypothetical protein
MSEPTIAMRGEDLPTEAYVRPPKATWRQAAEDRISRTRGIYDTIDNYLDALVSYSPAIAAITTLAWLIATHHR